MFYVYDSYLTDVAEWKRLLLPDGDTSVRGTFHDGLFVGLVVSADHVNQLAAVRGVPPPLTLSATGCRPFHRQLPAHTLRRPCALCAPGWL